MLEIIAQNVEDARIIEAAGADRIELVSAISEGGLTPSYAMIESVCRAVSIPVNVMVRPHAYHFEYSDETFEIMKRDIEMIESLGANGIVIGRMLNKRVRPIDIKTSCDITFHRSIDTSSHIIEDFTLLADSQVKQILTSAGPGKAIDHLALMDQLYEVNPKKLLIGSGVTLNNLRVLKERYPLASFHIGSDARVNQTFINRVDKKHLELLVKIVK